MEENKNRKARKGVGRKSKSDPAVYRYGIKFNSRENAQFELSFQKSGMAYRATDGFLWQTYSRRR